MKWVLKCRHANKGAGLEGRVNAFKQGEQREQTFHPSIHSFNNIPAPAMPGPVLATGASDPKPTQALSSRQ